MNPVNRNKGKGKKPYSVKQKHSKGNLVGKSVSVDNDDLPLGATAMLFDPKDVASTSTMPRSFSKLSLDSIDLDAVDFSDDHFRNRPSEPWHMDVRQIFGDINEDEDASCDEWDMKLSRGLNRLVNGSGGDDDPNDPPDASLESCFELPIPSDDMCHGVNVPVSQSRLNRFIAQAKSLLQRVIQIARFLLFCLKETFLEGVKLPLIAIVAVISFAASILRKFFDNINSVVPHNSAGSIYISMPNITNDFEPFGATKTRLAKLFTSPASEFAGEFRSELVDGGISCMFPGSKDPERFMYAFKFMIGEE